MFYKQSTELTICLVPYSETKVSFVQNNGNWESVKVALQWCEILLLVLGKKNLSNLKWRFLFIISLLIMSPKHLMNFEGQFCSMWLISRPERRTNPCCFMASQFWQSGTVDSKNLGIWVCVLIPRMHGSIGNHCLKLSVSAESHPSVKAVFYISIWCFPAV